MKTILDEIIAHKREEVAASRLAISLLEMRAQAQAAAPVRDFAAAITGPPVRIIAEVKRASPSQGAILRDADPTTVARLYESAGAAALSVLTDARYFKGSGEDLRTARAAVGLPVLRKDFIVDSYQIYEARAMGADAVLLIAGTVPGTVLADLARLTEALGMTALVEASTGAQLDDALIAGARVIGINNRDLRDFSVDLDTTSRLRPRIPAGLVVVSESGIETPEDVERVCRMGVNALLIGTALMGSPDPAAHLRALRLAAEGARTEHIGGTHP